MFKTWNHIKIFTKLEGSFKNQVPFEIDYRQGIRYESILHVHQCVFSCVRSTLRLRGQDEVESQKITHFFSTLIGRNSRKTLTKKNSHQLFALICFKNCHLPQDHRLISILLLLRQLIVIKLLIRRKKREIDSLRRTFDDSCKNQ